MAQHTPLPPNTQRVPIMDATFLDARTRPPTQEPTAAASAAQTRSRRLMPKSRRAWLRTLVARSPR